MLILDENGWNRVEQNLLQMKEDIITVNYEHLGYTVEVETRTAGHPWKVAMIVGVGVYKNNIRKIHQWFESVPQAKRWTSRWK